MRSLIRPQDWPIVIKLIAAFFLVALVPLAIVGIASPTQARKGLLETAERNLINTARSTSSAVDDYVSRRRSDVQQIATDESVINFLTADRSNLDLRSNRDALATRRLLISKANAIGMNNKPYYFIARVSKESSFNGRVELTSNAEKDNEGAVPNGEPSDVSSQVYFLEALKGFSYVSDPALTQFGDGAVDAIMYYSVPVHDANNSLVGVVVARSSIFPIWQLVNEDLNVVGAGSFGMLLDNTNRLGIRIADSRIKDLPQNRTKYLFSIMRSLSSSGDNSSSRYIESKRFPDNFNYQEAQQSLPYIYESAQVDYSKDTAFFNTKLGEDEARVAYIRLSVKPDWYYYVVVPQTTYAAAADQITQFTVVVLILSILLVIILAITIARFLTIPIRRISRVLTRIGMGDFDARVPINNADELGRLSESLNAMFDNTLNLIQTREEKDQLQERITTLLEEISTVAEGDLTVEADVTADITGAIADSFNLMIEELRKVILNIQQVTTQANTFFEQLVYNTQRTDQAADRQASRILNVSESIGDINHSIQRVSENTTILTQVAQEARSNAHQGGVAVTKSVSSMNRIRGNVQETAKKIKRLGESSQQIGEIVKLIDDIADQTNMLALNAAIQAAMAGEQGKGFSVVAEEVRRLAERSAGATREIALLVKSIQDDTAEAVVAMEESTGEVVEGSRVADEAGRALGSIETVVDRLADLIFSISQVTQQEAVSSTSIAQSMNEISSLTVEATSLRQESATAVQKLALIVQTLNTSVSTFKVSADREAKRTELLPSLVASPATSKEPPFSPDQLNRMAFQPEVPTGGPTGGSSYLGEANSLIGRNGVDEGTHPKRFISTPVAASDSRDSKVPSKESDNFDLHMLMGEDTDFFESLFGEKDKGKNS
ncbi:MAG: methyl-accepting chemotaxis protein [Chloroflexota bacterium]